MNKEQSGEGECMSAWSSKGGWVARSRPPGLRVTPPVFGGCSGPDVVGDSPKLGRTMQRGGGGGGNELDLQGPPAAIGVCPSDQLRPSLKPSLDFDLLEEQITGKGNS